MNKSVVMGSLLAVAALAGCRDPGPGTEESAAQTTPVEAPAETQPAATTPAPIALNTKFSVPLPGGIADPAFAYHVSVDREAARKGGGTSREVGIELLGTSSKDADAAFATLVLQAGGSVVSREEQGRAIRTVYLLKDGSQMLVWARPGAPRGERFVLQMPEATGTIYIAWPFSGS